MGDSSQRISKALYIWGQFEDSSLKELTALKDIRDRDRAMKKIRFIILFMK